MDNTLSLDRLSRHEALKQIQRKFKIIYLPPLYCGFGNQKVLKYGFLRIERPFTLKSVKHLFKNQKDRIIKIINNEKIDINKFSTGLAIKSHIILDRRYNEEEDAVVFDIYDKETKCIRFDKNNLENLLERFSNAIIKNLENIIGIQGFEFQIVFSQKKNNSKTK